jgi:hypothetical protein
LEKNQNSPENETVKTNQTQLIEVEESKNQVNEKED